MPTDPAELLALARKMNGLQNAGSAPWHLKGTYEILDDKGAVKEKGTFEEFWISDKDYKKTYSSPSFSQTNYSNNSGVFRVGSSDWPNEVTAMVERSLTPSFPSDESVAKRKLEVKSMTVGGSELKCLTTKSSTAVPLPPDLIYCFNTDRPILRLALSSGGLYQTVYNQISIVRGSYIGRDMEIRRLTKPFLHVHIDTLDAPATIDQAMLTAPPTAVPVSRRCSLDSAVDISRKVPPKYPAEAKYARVQGVVFLGAVIGKDGRIKDIQPISGQPMLIDPSMDAVRQWVYKPYDVDGEPVEVETVIRVVYWFAPYP